MIINVLLYSVKKLSVKVSIKLKMLKIILLHLLVGLVVVVRSQRPIVNSSTAATSLLVGSPAPSVLPSPRPRSDGGQMYFRPAGQDTNATANGKINPRIGKFTELKTQIRSNKTAGFNPLYNGFHDTYMTRQSNNKMSGIDRLRKITQENKNKLANPEQKDTPINGSGGKDTLREIMSVLSRQVI